MDVPYFNVRVSDAEIAEVVDTLRSGWLGPGKKVSLFETRFAEAEDAAHAVATNSCTSGLHLSVEALGAGPGTAILVPTHAWISCAEAAWNAGAVPILVDCCAETMHMDLTDAARKLSWAADGRVPGAKGQRLDVIGMIAVNYAGLLADQLRMRQFADDHGLWWISDAAHSTSAQLKMGKGRWAGEGAGLADLRVYSFYPNKPMTTGDGGMITTNDAAMAERLRRMANHGLSFSTWSGESRRDWDKQVMERGFKYTMTDIAASIGLHQLEKAQAMRLKRAAVAAQYNQAFDRNPRLQIPAERPYCRSAWHLYPLQLRDACGADRDKFISEVGEQGVDCRVQWRPLHAQPRLRELGWSDEHCPISTRSWQRLVSLPIHPGLTADQVSQVTRTIQDVSAHLFA